MLRSGETTPTALVEHFAERLDSVGRRYNAVVTIMLDRARREAAQAEAELKAGYDRGPLHGIPYGAKDLLATVGAPTTSGAAPLRAQAFNTAATRTRRPRYARAGLLATPSMAELAGGPGGRPPRGTP